MFESAFARAINHLLGPADWARARLLTHAGSRIRIATAIADITLKIGDDGLLAADDGGEPDLVIELPTEGLLGGLQGREALMRAARMRGRVELAESLGFVLRHLEWDVEEDLSRVTGDIVARRLVEGGRDAARSFAEGLRRLGDGTSEYVIHEARIAAPAEEVGDFCREVDDLRDRQERLAARLRRLEGSLGTRRAPAPRAAADGAPADLPLQVASG